MTNVFAGMAASLDGYIQSKDKDLSWLNNSMARDEAYGFEVSPLVQTNYRIFPPNNLSNLQSILLLSI